MNWIKEQMELEGKELKPETLNFIESHLSMYLTEYSDILINTQSPIEEKLGSNLYKRLQQSIYHKYDICELHSQIRIKTPNSDTYYVADFLLEVAHAETKKSVYVVIECDGHDFHEKTKQQVHKRYTRDRHLMLMGYTVVHFSGTEINRDPRGCSMDIINIITNRMEGRDYIKTSYPGDEDAE